MNTSITKALQQVMHSIKSNTNVMQHKALAVEKEIKSFIERLKRQERIYLPLRTESCQQFGENKYKQQITLPQETPRYGKLFVIRLDVDPVDSKDLKNTILKQGLVAYKRINNVDLLLAWKNAHDQYVITIKRFFSANHPPVHLAVAMRSGAIHHLLTFCGTNGYGPIAPIGIKPNNVPTTLTFVESKEHYELFLPKREETFPSPKRAKAIEKNLHSLEKWAKDIMRKEGCSDFNFN